MGILEISTARMPRPKGRYVTTYLDLPEILLPLSTELCTRRQEPIQYIVVKLVVSSLCPFRGEKTKVDVQYFSMKGEFPVSPSNRKTVPLS